MGYKILRLDEDGVYDYFKNKFVVFDRNMKFELSNILITEREGYKIYNKKEL